MQPALRLLILLACAGIIASLFTHPFACSAGGGWGGREVLEPGWIGVVIFDPRWLANPAAAWLAVVAFRGRTTRGASLVAALTSAFAISALLIPTLACGGGAGGAELSLGLREGGYLWVASVSLIALCAMLAQRRAPASPEVAGPSAEGLDAVQAALASYRAGVQVRARCPNCRSVLLLRRSQTRSAAGAGCVDVACACRTCDGTYEVRAARRA